jgi:hypothetical protein
MNAETEVRKPEPRVVSLDLELATLESATRGAEILADLESRHGLMDEDMEEDTPVSIMSILALVGGRFEQLRRVIRGEEDPGNIWGPQNAIGLPESLADVDGDILLFAWNACGMPLVLARPSGWGLDPEELEKRKAMGQEGWESKGSETRKAKEPKGPKGRKVQGQQKRKTREPSAKEPREQAPEPPGAEGETPKETPPSGPEPT